jgi:disulfide oxidoreductase YuzD
MDLEKYYKINIYKIGPTGLVNQFINLVNGLLLGHLTKRNIYNPNFLPNYNSLSSIPLSEILDIDQLNKLLTNTQILMSNNLYNWSTVHQDKFAFNTSLESIINILNQDDHPYVDLGLVFAIYRTTNELVQFQLNIYKNLPFKSQYYDVLNYCKSNYLGTKYNAIHLRLEDDWPHYGSNDTPEIATEKIVKSYYDAMSQLFLPIDTIYIATHLIKSKNKNDWVIGEIEKKYPNCVFSISWRDQFPDIPQGREIDALIDYLICRNAEKFIGMSG